MQNIDKDNHNPSAFPTSIPDLHGSEGAISEGCVSFGMTLRDYFAAKAMCVLIPNEGWTDTHFDRCAKESTKRAYQIADAMLTARNGGGE